MNDIREDLKAFVDGELSPEGMSAVQAAIDSDPKIAQEVEYMRLLGLEIRRLAAEPAVEGKEKVVEKFRQALLPWWNPATLSGRLAYAGALFIVLLGIGSVMFPVFAQSKFAAKRNLARSEVETAARGEWQGMPAPGSESETPASAAAADNAPAYKAPQTPGEQFRYGGRTGVPIDLGVPTGGSIYAEESSGMGGAGEKAKARSFPNRPGRTSGSQPITPEAKKEYQAPASNRMVIKNADITVRVDDAKKAMTSAEALAKGLGGYTEGSSIEMAPDQTPRANIIIRVPARSYETAMARLREMGEVPYESSNAQDVTAQYADLDGRLRVLRAEEDSYVTMLRAARKVGELMEIKDRLSSVRQEIASMESQRKALAGESSLSTIRATFEQKAKIEEEDKKKESGFEETWAKAVNGLSAVGEFLGNAAIYLFVFSPVWLPPVILFWWLGKRARA